MQERLFFISHQLQWNCLDRNCRTPAAEVSGIIVGDNACNLWDMIDFGELLWKSAAKIRLSGNEQLRFLIVI
ncbi:MAG: hypothetical protein ACXV4Z_06485 [Halobacteriota archaeon]